MDKLYEYAKDGIVNFKLERCCCVAPIRIGLFITGYCNVFVALISLVGIADGGITPPLMAVQEIILADNVSKPIGILAYAAELAFNALLLCGMYRNDIVILRVYIYFVIAAIISSLLVYSIVIAAVNLLIKILIIWGLIFHCYVILLVRSAIVEIKETRTSEKNGHVTLYSMVPTPDEVVVSPKSSERPDVEVEVETEPKDENPQPEQKRDEHSQSEQSKDEHSQSKQKKGEHSQSKQKKDEHSQFVKKKAEQSQSEQKEDEKSHSEQKKDEHSQSAQKKDKTGQSEQKKEESSSKNRHTRKGKHPQPEQKKDEPPANLETVNEHPKE